MKTGLAAGLAVALLGTAAVAAWVWWPRPAAAPAARHYLDVSACLLTDPSGIAPGTPAAPVWAAMQPASLASHVMVSYLPDTGPSDVGAMLNTLIERRCGVIIATGKSAAGVIAAGKANPHQSFLLVAAPGAATAAGTPNTVIVSAADAPGRIDHVIRALAANAPVPGS
ncbi:MAG TPA: hypothetical protein VIY52_22470 [Streptosporangiaceae bacterium]